MIREYWKQLQKKNKIDKVEAKAEPYLLDLSRWKSYHRLKSYSGLWSWFLINAGSYGKNMHFYDGSRSDADFF